MKALILIAHGSKKESSNIEFLKMVENIKNKNSGYEYTEGCFLELADPDIESTVLKFVLKDIKRVDFYPFFLNSGKHVLIDIPNIVEKLKEKYPQVNLNLLNHFGKSKNIERIILEDIS